MVCSFSLWKASQPLLFQDMYAVTFGPTDNISSFFPFPRSCHPLLIAFLFFTILAGSLPFPSLAGRSSSSLSVSLGSLVEITVSSVEGLSGLVKKSDHEVHGSGITGYHSHGLFGCSGMPKDDANLKDKGSGVRVYILGDNLLTLDVFGPAIHQISTFYCKRDGDLKVQVRERQTGSTPTAWQYLYVWTCANPKYP